MYRQEQLAALLTGKRILIAGYGREGQSAERLVKRLAPESPLAVADGNGPISAEAGSGRYDMIIKSPGVPMRVIPEQALHTVTSLTDMFLQVYADRVVGITGTKGKSTTASLIHHLLPGSVLAGNIGIPLFDILDDLDESTVVVAELSCHQLEVLHRSPHVAVVLNLFQEHLDHYESYHGYMMAKMQIALHQREGDCFYYCTDNDELQAMVNEVKDRLQGALHPYSITSLTADERTLLEACPLSGEHNKSNALVASRVASLVLGQPLMALGPRLATFHGLRHRLERVGERRGIVWYDDSISTIPAATIAAVKALGNVETLILGGFDRGIDYSPLVAFLGEAHASLRNIAFVGQAGRRIRSLLADGVNLFNTLVEDDYTRIVPWCAEHTQRGGTVLLSPAAASYDAFKNFEVRGDFFRQQIMNL